MHRILTFAPSYLPGHKAGGPIKSLANLHRALGDDFAFFVLTPDRDLGDTHPYPGIDPTLWHTVGTAQVRYLTPEEQAIGRICALIDEVEPDLIYLNGFFSPRFSILPLAARRMGKVRKVPVLLAPRGEFSMGALALKRTKKRVYMRLAAAIGMFDGLNWHASSSFERDDILRALRPAPDAISIAANVTDSIPESPPPGPRDDDPLLHIAFLSRISPMKNLDYALEALAKVKVPIRFNLYGPAEDPEYWARCQSLMKALPSHVEAHYHGPVAPAAVASTLRANDLLLLPTRGENFGHVIAESLAVGTPVLISDRTPWRSLQSQGLGDDLSLDNPQAFVETIHAAAKMSPEARQERRASTHSAFRDYSAATQDLQANRDMFLKVIEKGASRMRTGDR